MLDERRIDAGLEVLARYRGSGPGERFFLWFSYPGLREEFGAIDRATGGRGNERLSPVSAQAPGAGQDQSWPNWTGACLSRPRRDSSPDCVAVGCCRGR